MAYLRTCQLALLHRLAEVVQHFGGSAHLGARGGEWPGLLSSVFGAGPGHFSPSIEVDLLRKSGEHLLKQEVFYGQNLCQRQNDSDQVVSRDG